MLTGSSVFGSFWLHGRANQQRSRRRRGADRGGRAHLERSLRLEPLEQRCMFAGDFRSIDGSTIFLW